MTGLKAILKANHPAKRNHLRRAANLIRAGQMKMMKSQKEVLAQHRPIQKSHFLHALNLQQDLSRRKTGQKEALAAKEQGIKNSLAGHLQAWDLKSRAETLLRAMPTGPSVQKH